MLPIHPTKFLIIIFGMWLLGCVNGPDLTKEVRQLRIENQKLTFLVDSLNSSAENRYNRATKSLDEGEDSIALVQFKELVSIYRQSPYTKESEKSIDELEAKIKKKKIEEERLKSLGFRAIKPHSIIKFDYLDIKFTGAVFKESFVFDSYDDSYRYRSAERGSKYLVVNATISSEVNNPNLPYVLGYVLNDGVLECITPLGLEYRFRRWEDYGSYLGNNADYGNDFAHTKTIAFNLGYSVRESEYKGKDVYLVLYKSKSFVRESSRFDNPPVSYKSEDFGYKSKLTVNDFQVGGDYVLVKIL